MASSLSSAPAVRLLFLHKIKCSRAQLAEEVEMELIFSAVSSLLNASGEIMRMRIAHKFIIQFSSTILMSERVKRKFWEVIYCLIVVYFYETLIFESIFVTFHLPLTVLFESIYNTLTYNANLCGLTCY